MYTVCFTDERLTWPMRYETYINGFYCLVVPRDPWSGPSVPIGTLANRKTVNRLRIWPRKVTVSRILHHFGKDHWQNIFAPDTSANHLALLLKELFSVKITTTKKARILTNIFIDICISYRAYSTVNMNCTFCVTLVQAPPSLIGYGYQMGECVWMITPELH